jgi:thiol-disulfide isomerase/thioredoxin
MFKTGGKWLKCMALCVQSFTLRTGYFIWCDMMMKRNAWLIGSAAVAVIAGILVNACVSKDKETATSTPVASTSRNDMPNFRVTYGDQSSTSLREQTGNVMLVFFNPDCDHCHKEAEQMAADKQVFDGWQVYFIASVDAKTAEEFGVKYKLTEPNFHFGFAAVSDVYNAIGALTQVPTIMLFKDRTFIQKYEGVTSIEDLKKSM